jgi:hypothetical protein
LHDLPARCTGTAGEDSEVAAQPDSDIVGGSFPSREGCCHSILLAAAAELSTDRSLNN